MCQLSPSPSLRYEISSNSLTAASMTNLVLGMFGVGQTVITEPEVAFLEGEGGDDRHVLGSPFLQSTLLDGDCTVEDAALLCLSIWDCKGC